MKPSPKKLKETKEIYHTVVEHLIEEGYATDSDSADNIIKGMSDEWFETIIEDESLAGRTKRAVQNQRDGFHGDSHAIRAMQRKTQRSVNKLKEPTIKNA